MTPHERVEMGALAIEAEICPLPPVDVAISMASLTAGDLVNLPGESVAVIEDFSADRLDRLEQVMNEAFDLVAANHRAPSMGTAIRPLMVPVVYVLGQYPDLGARLIGRITASGATFVERDKWPNVRKDFEALYR